MKKFDFKTVPDIIKQIEENYSNPTAFNYYENGVWLNLSTQEFIYNLKRLTYGLISQGVKKGDYVGIMANPSPYWTMADLAIILAGGISVPLFANISDENFIYEVAQTGIRYLFVDGAEQQEMYRRHRNLFDQVITLSHREVFRGTKELHEVLKAGEHLWRDKPELFDELMGRYNPNDIMTVVYTSGSTGVPKGVMLSHLNLMHLANYSIFKPDASKDKYISILPLAHIFSRQINFINMAWGVSIYYLNDLSQFASVCSELQPTMMIVVPRVLEKTYSGFLAAMEKQKGFVLRISNWAINLANTMEKSFFQRYFALPIADFFVYSKLRKSLGGKWRIIFCGGAALDPKLAEFFLSIKFPIYEGWGLTEGSTAVVNRPGTILIPGYVGLPLPEEEIRIGTDGEVLLKGPTVMRGYFRNPEITGETLDKDGWLHTGDKGELNDEGYLKIVGRIKEHVKLATGEWLIPARIEYALCESPLIYAAVVIGEKKKFASCLLFPDLNFMRRMKAKLNYVNITDQEFLETELMKKEVRSLIDLVNSNINKWEKIQQYRFVLEPLTIDDGALTPTLKVKRDVIIKKYQHLIKEMYGEK